VSLNCQQIRDIVKARGHLLCDGHTLESSLVQGLGFLRDEYRVRVGKESYVSQMLGEMERCAMEMCTLTWPGGRQVIGNRLRRSIQAQRCYTWIVENCGCDDLPFMVEAHLCAEHTAVRFL
jgi:hypothetical protein